MSKDYNVLISVCHEQEMMSRLAAVAPMEQTLQDVREVLEVVE